MRLRSLFLACVLPLAATGTVYGCSGNPAPEDLCGWLQNPEGNNCVADFHEDIGTKCGAADPTTVTGQFLKREALDVCVLSQGGAIVFDPPIDFLHFPSGMATSMKIMNPDGSACGEISQTSQFSWSLKIAAPPPVMGSSTSTSSTSGAGGAAEDSGPHYSNGTISVTSLGEQTVQVDCPAPDHSANSVAGPESHIFNLNQSLAATPQNGCPQFAQIIPQAILEVDPGGVLLTGSVRLKIQFPPVATAATSGAGGAGGATSSTGSGTATLIAPEVVFYFDCAIPGAPLLCANGIKDGSERDVDCGGPESQPNCPARCTVGQLCVNDCDCDAASSCKVLNGLVQCVIDPMVPSPDKGVCSEIICANKVKDASESDIDCGGSCPAKCHEGQVCGKNEDCDKNSCTLKVCGPPVCTDNSTNGDETDIDCGGAICKKCDETQTCKADSDCLKGGCSPAGVCSACFNKTTDGSESGLDCGGSCAKKCAEGQPCKTGIDCETNVCTAGVCNGCGDLVKDGKESDIDCGGPFCPKCVDGKTCMAATDCVDNGCLNTKCSACADGAQDNNESDIDCGFSGKPSDPAKVACPKCDNGKVCFNAADCISGQCDGNKCGSCADGVKDGDESDVDCGGTVCAKCPETKVCNDSADCLFGVCELPPVMSGTGGAGGAGTSSSTGGGPITGICNTCNDAQTNGTESDLNCGGATCKKCKLGDDCKVNLDCTSGICINKLCK